MNNGHYYPYGQQAPPQYAQQQQQQQQLAPQYAQQQQQQQPQHAQQQPQYAHPQQQPRPMQQTQLVQAIVPAGVGPGGVFEVRFLRLLNKMHLSVFLPQTLLCGFVRVLPGHFHIHSTLCLSSYFVFGTCAILPKGTKSGWYENQSDSAPGRWTRPACEVSELCSLNRNACVVVLLTAHVAVCCISQRFHAPVASPQPSPQQYQQPQQQFQQQPQQQFQQQPQQQFQQQPQQQFQQQPFQQQPTQPLRRVNNHDTSIAAAETNVSEGDQILAAGGSDAVVRETLIGSSSGPCRWLDFSFRHVRTVLLFVLCDSLMNFHACVRSKRKRSSTQLSNSFLRHPTTPRLALLLVSCAHLAWRPVLKSCPANSDLANLESCRHPIHRWPTSPWNGRMR